MHVVPSLALIAWGVAVASESIAPTMPIAAIMAQVVTPASNQIWTLGATYYEGDGNAEAAALSEEQWEAADEAAKAMSGAAEALRTPGRPVAGPDAAIDDTEAGLTPEQIGALIHGQRDAWEAEVQAMDNSMEAVRAAIAARDLEGLADAGNVLYETCDSCHRRFWYPVQ